MRVVMIAAAAAVAASGVALANGHDEQCFDKGTLTYFDCPTEEVLTFDGLRLGAHVGYSWGQFEDDDGDEADFDGALFGASIGYFVDFGTVIVGAEADADLSTAEIDEFGTEGDWMASARAVLGYEFVEGTMAYATAGYELQEIDEDGASFDGEGYTVGGGLEHLVGGDVALRIEYRYSDYEDTFSDNVDYDQHAVRTGVGFRF